MDDFRKYQIEQEARRLHKELWTHRKKFLHNDLVSPSNIVKLIDPKNAARVLGYEFEQYKNLGESFGFKDDKFEVAGHLDRNRKLVSVSMKFGNETARFTAGHEIGHLSMHPNQNFFRDRPIRGLEYKKSRPVFEAEADYYSACYLVPENLLIDQFKARFGESKPFLFDDNSAFWLSPNCHGSLLRPESGSPIRELTLASANSYGGRHFDSLSRVFKVSTSTLAIRLVETGLVIPA